MSGTAPDCSSTRSATTPRFQLDCTCQGEFHGWRSQPEDRKDLPPRAWCRWWSGPGSSQTGLCSQQDLHGSMNHSITVTLVPQQIWIREIYTLWSVKLQYVPLAVSDGFLVVWQHESIYCYQRLQRMLGLLGVTGTTGGVLGLRGCFRWMACVK